PDLDGIPVDIKKRAKLLVINYPNSPTGAIATKDFFKRVMEFAHKNQVVIVQDAAHILLTYQGEPLSFMQMDGAKEVGVEVHSMSKGFNMIGWRLGFVCGHPKIVQAYADVKDNSDSGQFMAIQHAAAQALRTPEIPERVRAKYKRRLEKLVAALKPVGFRCAMPGGTYFLYTQAPTGAGDRSFANAEEASQYLIHEQSVCCVPWDDTVKEGWVKYSSDDANVAILFPGKPQVNDTPNGGKEVIWEGKGGKVAFMLRFDPFPMKIDPTDTEVTDRVFEGVKSGLKKSG